jgi:predicted alpha/beta-hydrolase family hydrolase
VTAQPLTISLPSGGTVAALLAQPDQPLTCYVLAHGAGAGMEHPFMADLAARLHERGVAVLRFQFPFMQQGSRRPDSPAVAHAAVRAAVAQASQLLPGVPLFAGGKSFGARMSSQAQALDPLPGVRGLVFVGFPLHPAGKPGITRAEHLQQVQLPMLFLQGTRDALAELKLLRPVVQQLGKRATLHTIEHADHAFHVPVRSGRRDGDVLDELAATSTDWMRAR